MLLSGIRLFEFSYVWDFFSKPTHAILQELHPLSIDAYSREKHGTYPNKHYTARN